MSYILTLVASDHLELPVQEMLLKRVGEILNHFDIHQTCQPIWLHDRKAVDLGLSAKPNRAVLIHLRDLCDRDRIDVFVTNVEKRRKKLLLADMDSTIVHGETLDDLAEFAGLKAQISEITQKAMEGEMDFHDALRARVKLLENLPVDALRQTMDQTHINPGALELVKIMKKHGAKCVLISGGFTYFTSRIAREVGFDHHHGNHLQIEDEKLTGKVEEPILDKYSKLEFLKYYAQSYGLTLGHTMTIGDGANDIPMLKNAGLGIGYKPKQAVQREIDNHIIHGDLSAALYAQGYTYQHFK
jgi:phosphoserine phosphatase